MKELQRILTSKLLFNYCVTQSIKMNVSSSSQNVPSSFLVLSSVEPFVFTDINTLKDSHQYQYRCMAVDYNQYRYGSCSNWGSWDCCVMDQLEVKCEIMSKTEKSIPRFGPRNCLTNTSDSAVRSSSKGLQWRKLQRIFRAFVSLICGPINQNEC